MVSFKKTFLVFSISLFLAVGCGGESGKPTSSARSFATTFGKIVEGKTHLGFGILIVEQKILRFINKSIPQILATLSNEGIKIVRIDKLIPGIEPVVTVPAQYTTVQSEVLGDQFRETNIIGFYRGVLDSRLDLESLNLDLKDDHLPRDVPVIGLPLNATREVIFHEYLHYLIDLFYTGGKTHNYLINNSVKAQDDNGNITIRGEIYKIPRSLGLNFTYLSAGKSAEKDFNKLYVKKIAGEKIPQQVWEECCLNYVKRKFSEMQYFSFTESEHIAINRYLYEKAEVLKIEDKRETLERFRLASIIFLGMNLQYGQASREIDSIIDKNKEDYSAQFIREKTASDQAMVDFINSEFYIGQDDFQSWWEMKTHRF